MVSAKAGESAASAGRSPAKSRAFHPVEFNVFIGIDSSDAAIEDLPGLGHLRNHRRMGGRRYEPMSAVLHDGNDVGGLVRDYEGFRSPRRASTRDGKQDQRANCATGQVYRPDRILTGNLWRVVSRAFDAGKRCPDASERRGLPKGESTRVDRDGQFCM